MFCDDKIKDLKKELRRRLRECGIEDIHVENTHEDVDIFSINGFYKESLLDCELFSEKLPEGLLEDLASKSEKSPEQIKKAIWDLENSSSIWLLAKPFN